MVPIVAGALTAAKSSAVSDAVSRVSEGFAGLFGDTPTDKARKARATQLTARAIDGDMGALRQLTFDAFEQRRGQIGDDRKPVDGKMSPQDVRTLAKRGLKLYVESTGGIPPEIGEYASQIGAPILTKPQGILERIITPAINTVTDQALDRATVRAKETASSAAPWIIGGGIAVLALAAVLIFRK
jgi:hypothetical protein